MSKLLERASFILGFLALIYPAYILLHLNRGLDLTDTGFYYLAIQNNPDVMSGPTLFGSVWSVLPLPESFHMHRLAVLGLLWLSAGFLANTLFNLYGNAKQRLDRYAITALSIGAISTFYTWWIPDPSYNSITLILIPTVLALALRITSELQLKQQVPKWTSVWVGVLLLALGLTRPQSAALLSPAMLMFVLFFARPTWRQIYLTGAFVMLGAGAFLLSMAIFVEPTSVSWERLLTGYVDRGILELERAPGAAASQFKEQAMSIVANKWLWILGLIGGLMLRNGAVRPRMKRQANVKSAGDLFVALILLFASVMFVNETLKIEKFNLTNIAHFVFPWILGLGVTALSGIISGLLLSREENFEKDVVLLLIIFGLIAQVVLTGNQWLKFSGSFAFYLLMALIFYAKFRTPTESNWSFLSVIVVVLAVQFAAFKQSSQNPYGLNKNLRAQTVPTQIGSDRNILKLDQGTHDFLVAFEEGRGRIAELSKAPVIIDTSGRFPMLTFHLGGYPTRWPWLMSTHPGSKNMIENSLSSLSPEQLEKAWIIVAPDWRRSHDMTILEKYGINASAGYSIISKSYSPAIKSEVWLLAPEL